MAIWRFEESGVDYGQLIVAEYSLPIVFISVLIACSAGYAGLSIAGQVSQIKRRAIRYFWFAAGSFAMGLGIWAMHFTGMIAYKTATPVSYSIPITILSAIPALVGSALVLSLLHAKTCTWQRNQIIAMCFAGCIALMHYTGMEAMRMSSILKYDFYYFLLSLFIAHALASLALVIKYVDIGTFPIPNRYRQPLSAVVMGCSISGMHYTAMEATRMYTSGVLFPPDSVLSDQTLVILVILITSLVLMIVIAYSTVQAHQQIAINAGIASLLLNSTGEGIYSIDLNGRCTFANRSCLELLGFHSEQELLGKNMHKLMHHTHNDGTPYPVEDCKIYQAFRKGEGSDVDTEVLWRKDGSSFPSEYHSFPIFERGEVLGAVVSFTDISAKKLLEQEKKFSEARFRSFFEVSQEGILFHDQSKIMDINPKGEELLGYESSELLGQSVLVAVAAESQELVIEKIKTRTPSAYEVKLLRKDGTTTDAEVISKPIMLKGESLKVVTFRDISDRKIIENKIKNIASELAQLIDTANAPIFGINTRLQINEWNQAAVKLTGYDKDEVMDCLFIHEFIEDANRESVSAIFKSAVAGEETANFELNLRTKSGRQATVLFNTTTRRDMDGEVTGVIGIGQDITALRQKENALNQAQKMEAVGQLTGGIAHDFNNLLSIISSNLRFLQQDIGETTAEIKELFEDARSAVDDGSDLTKRLLGLSSNRSLQTEISDVSDTIKKFGRFLARTLAAGIKLDLDVPDQALIIDIDSSQLENALLNLSINARDAMPQGGKITISAEQYYAGDGDGDGDGHRNVLALRENNYIKISIIDAGSGISSEDLQRVYEPFFTTKEVGKGSGLGLSMVYAFTQQSDGACHIESTLGEGTTVSMYFPEAMDHQPVEKPPEEGKTIVRGSEVILVVEDEPRVRRAILRDLKTLGYETLEAENADRAKAIIESGKHIDLLFTDVLMPGEMDGHMLGAWTAKHYPEIKVVLTSGYSIRKSTPDFYDSALPMVRKPYSIEKLALQLRTSLEN